MSRLILFNERRGGEVSRFLLYSYQVRPKWEEGMNKEILDSLQGLELALIKRIELIEVPGKKKTRKVLILVTEEAKKTMETLKKTRHSAGITNTNPYFFASKSSDGYLNSWQAMKAVVDGAAVHHQGNISSTRLRKERERERERAREREREREDVDCWVSTACQYCSKVTKLSNEERERD